MLSIVNTLRRWVSPIRLAAMASLVVIAKTSLPAVAQCTYEWKSGGSYPGVSSTEVYAIATWDPDGPGPQPELTVVGGNFEIAGRHYVNNIAAFDGELWMPLGGGVTTSIDKPIVREIVVHNGQLIAAGRFTSAGGSAVQYIARWDGAQWHTVGEGLPAECVALISHDGELFAAGFGWQTQPGYIRRWNGAQWIASEAGLPFVSTFARFQGSLLAASYDGVFRWTGSSWQMFAPVGPNYAQINTMVEFAGDLIVGGSFGGIGGVFARHIARWNGQAWQAMGSGFYDGPQDMAAVRTCVVANGRLYAAGSITLPFYPEQAGVAEWTGTEWLPLGGAFAIDVFASGVRSGRPLFGGPLVVGECCGFDALGGVVQQWDGVAEEWQGLLDIEPPQLRQITAFKGDLYAISKGPHESFWGRSTILRFHNGSWAPVGTITDSEGYETIATIRVFGDHLLVGGHFVGIEGVAASCIAAWNGQTWTEFGGGVRGEYPFVNEFTEFNGRLVAAGRFDSAGGDSIKAIASWNGSSWEAFGGGISGYYPTDPYVSVTGILNRPGEMIIAGHFGAAGNIPVTSLAKWDGANWSPIGAPFADAPSSSFPWVNTIVEYQSRLVCGGRFQASDSGATFIAAWDGSIWQPLGSGPSGTICVDMFDSDVNSLAVLGNDLYAGGYFLSAGGATVRGVARWDGAAWHPLGTPPGVESEYAGWCVMVESVKADNGRILVEGYFAKAGGVPSNSLAYWAPAGPTPLIVEEPRSTAVCPQQPATLSISVSPFEPATYQWRHNLIPLIDNAVFSGTGSPLLSILAVDSETTGVYDCVVSSECSIVVSSPASVMNAPHGGADGNGDGRVDGRDVEVMVYGIISDTTGPSACRLDMNYDGAVSAADIPLFIALMLAQ